MNTYTHIGIDFVDEHGERFTSVQMVSHASGKAIATACFHGPAVTRCLAIDGIDLAAFLRQAHSLRDCSTPIQFRLSALPD